MKAMLMSVTILLAVAAYAVADVTITEVTTEQPAGTTSQSITCWKPGMLAVQSGQTRTIIRFDKKVVWTYTQSDDGNTYQEMTFDQLKNMGATMKQMQAAALEGLEPEQRAIVEKMMGNMAASAEPKTVLEKLGDTKNVNGYPCVHFKRTTATATTKTTSDIWATKEIKVPDQMKKDLVEFSELFKNMPGAGKQGRYDVEMGMPILTDTTEAPGVHRIMELKSIEEGPVDAAIFEVPEGTPKVEME